MLQSLHELHKLVVYCYFHEDKNHNIFSLLLQRIVRGEDIDIKKDTDKRGLEKIIEGMSRLVKKGNRVENVAKIRYALCLYEDLLDFTSGEENVWNRLFNHEQFNTSKGDKVVGNHTVALFQLNAYLVEYLAPIKFHDEWTSW